MKKPKPSLQSGAGERMGEDYRLLNAMGVTLGVTSTGINLSYLVITNLPHVKMAKTSSSQESNMWQVGKPTKKAIASNSLDTPCDSDPATSCDARQQPSMAPCQMVWLMPKLVSTMNTPCSQLDIGNMTQCSKALQKSIARNDLTSAYKHIQGSVS